MRFSLLFLLMIPVSSFSDITHLNEFASYSGSKRGYSYHLEFFISSYTEDPAQYLVDTSFMTGGAHERNSRWVDAHEIFTRTKGKSILSDCTRYGGTLEFVITKRYGKLPACKLRESNFLSKSPSCSTSLEWPPHDFAFEQGYYWIGEVPVFGVLRAMNTRNGNFILEKMHWNERSPLRIFGNFQRPSRARSSRQKQKPIITSAIYTPPSPGR